MFQIPIHGSNLRRGNHPLGGGLRQGGDPLAGPGPPGPGCWWETPLQNIKPLRNYISVKISRTSRAFIIGGSMFDCWWCSSSNFFFSPEFHNLVKCINPHPNTILGDGMLIFATPFPRMCRRIRGPRGSSRSSILISSAARAPFPAIDS